MKTNHLSNKLIKWGNKKILFAAVLCSLSTSTAFSGTDTATINVSATVAGASSCSITVGGLSFGTYSGVEVLNQISYTVNCSGSSTLWSLDVDGGLSVDVNNRSMIGTNLGSLLSYQIYQDAGHTQPFISSFVGSGPMTQSIYALLPGGQQVSDDTYADALAVTLTF